MKQTVEELTRLEDRWTDWTEYERRRLEEEVSRNYGCRGEELWICPMCFSKVESLRDVVEHMKQLHSEEGAAEEYLRNLNKPDPCPTCKRHYLIPWVDGIGAAPDRRGTAHGRTTSQYIRLYVGGGGGVRGGGGASGIGEEI